MDLIAKNKIAAYIEQHPEVGSALVLWLKEFDYITGARFDRQAVEHPTNRLIHGESTLFKTGYVIKYIVNLSLKAVYISWIGTEEEKQAELAKYLAANPNVRIVKKTITTQAPPPVSANVTTATISKTAFSRIIYPFGKGPLPKKIEVIPAEKAPGDNSLLTLYSQAEYEQALERMIAIFGAQPGTPEFEESGQLLLLIRKYEREVIKFPELRIGDAIKLKMGELHMEIMDFATGIQESEENTLLFLDNRKTLSKDKLEWMFYNFRMDYAIDNPDFFT